ncbi:hypothetical protein LguiA_003470 [Lonicera macranthoides]
MGGRLSKGSSRPKKSSSHTNYYGGSGGGLIKSNVESKPQVGENREKQSDELKEPNNSFRESRVMDGYGSSDDEFYDGIPRFSRDLSRKSRSFRSKAKVSEVSSRLGRAGSLGLGKAVDVLDTLGSSMTNLNTSSGFVSGVTIKGNELSILSFEVANTIVKGQSIMLSLSKRSIRQLKEQVLPSEGIQHLVSTDMEELLRIVADDKREELKLFAGEVVRFGNRCKDPQWHNLDLYFEKHSKEPPKQKEEADSVMQQLMTVVQYTAVSIILPLLKELYHELHMLDRLEQDQQLLKYQVTDISAHKGETRKGDIKTQRKQVRNLKKKSLWSRSMEEVMGKLVDIVLFLNREIHNAFTSADGNTTSNGSPSIKQRLGPAGLSLHYANIVLIIDSLVARSNSMPANTRDTLYQSLPPNMKSSLRSKLQSFHVKEEFTVTEIKAEMEKTLQWLVPIAMNTAKPINGSDSYPNLVQLVRFGRNMSEANRRSTTVTDIIRIDTLHYADKEKTEVYILDLVLWLNHLINQTKGVAGGGPGVSSPMKAPIQSAANQNAASTTTPPAISIEDQQTRAVSENQDMESVENMLLKQERLSESSDHNLKMGTDEIDQKHTCGVPVIDFGVDKEKALDVIDRVDARA